MSVVAIKPKSVAIPDSGIFVGTAGSAEKEAVALLVVRWHHLNSPEEWVGIRLGDFTNLLRVDEYAKSRFGDNPILLHCLLYGMAPFIEEGFVDGWVWGDKESVGIVTEKFTSALAKSPWARAEVSS